VADVRCSERSLIADQPDQSGSWKRKLFDGAIKLFTKSMNSRSTGGEEFKEADLFKQIGSCRLI